MMKPRTTLLFLGVFLALLAYVYFGEMRRPAGTDATATPTPAPILSIPADQVVGITVRGGGKETRLTRPAGGPSASLQAGGGASPPQAAGEWKLEAPSAEPGAGPADTVRVGQFLSRVASLNPTRSLADAGALEEYGLAQPALEVTLTLAGGSTQVLQIGAQNPQQNANYAKVQGQNGVHLVAALIAQSAQEMLDTPPVPPTPTPAATSTPAATPAS